MAVSRAIHRLLNVRKLEEEQSRLALESALADLNRLQGALAATAELGRQGRRLLASSAQTGELLDRLAGMEQSLMAARRVSALLSGKGAVEHTVEDLRKDYLARRVERRQAETLIQESEAKVAVEATRHGQQALDDWHRSRGAVSNPLGRTEANSHPAYSMEDISSEKDRNCSERS